MPHALELRFAAAASARRASSAVACVVVASALAASEVHAQCPGAPVATLLDGGGFRWDLDATGAVVDGSDGVFDGLYTMTINGMAFTAPMAPTTELSGRQYVFGPNIFFSIGVAVERRVYVPTGEAWARWVDELTNTRATSNTVTIELRSNSGANDMLVVVGTSDGDTTLEATDRTFVLDNELTMPPPPELPMETPPPATCHVVSGAGGRVGPSAITSGAGFTCAGAEGVTVRFTLDMPPMSTMRLLYFASQANLRAEASASCAALALLPASAFADIPGADRAQIVNWPVALPDGQPCTVGAGCASGHCVDGVCCESACGGGARDDCQACSGPGGSTAPDGTCGVVRGTYECRPAASVCDVLERCDGSARTCPPDVVRPAGMLCRGASPGQCDVADLCDGTSPLCPPDAVLPAGTVCDSFATIPCWTGGICTGTDPRCPIARELPDRSPCDDGVSCTVAWCMSGACLPRPVGCDDGDACTTDACADGVTCTHAPVAGCDGGLPPIPDGGPPEFPDVGPVDAAGDLDGGRLDAGPRDASTDDGGRMDARVRRDGDPLTTADLAIGGGGCACRARAPRGPLGAGAPSLLVGLALLGVARRRTGRAAAPG